MDFNRAKQIFASKQHINVTYNGKPVWIDELYDSNRTAQVHVVDSSGSPMQVSVEELSE